MSEPGFHADVPEDEYHADRDSLSQSGAKLILQAPALYRWRLDHPETKRVWDLGHAAHTKVSGVGGEVVIVQREVKDKKGEVLEVVDADDYKTTSAQEHRDQIRADGKVPLLAKEADQVDAMAEALAAHAGAMRLLAAGQPEVSAYARDEFTGVLLRCRYDYLREDLGIDYKTCADVSPSGFRNAAARNGYDQQAAWYLDVAELLDLDLADFAFIAQAKEPPYLVEVYNLDADFIARGRARNRAAIERYARCIETGVWPGHTGRDFTTLSAPRWAAYDNDWELTG